MTTAAERKHLAALNECGEFEIWKPILGYELLYEASNLGRIRSIPRKVKTSFGIATKGGNVLKAINLKRTKYLAVSLSGNGNRKQELIHRLILLAFIGNPKTGQEACHNNGIRSDNRLVNLRWDSRKNNHADKIIHGTWQIGEKNPSVKYSREIINYVKSSGLSIPELNKKLKISKTHLARIIKGESRVMG